MAQTPSAKIPPVWVPLFGVFLIGIAFWNVTDEAFCSSSCGNLTAPIFSFLYATFGHWGPRGFLGLVGVAIVIAYFVRRRSAPEGQR